MKKNLNTNLSDQLPDNDETDNHLEYPLYPESEDIYNRFKKEKDMDPEDISKVKKLDKSDKARTNIEKGVIRLIIAEPGPYRIHLTCLSGQINF